MILAKTKLHFETDEIICILTFHKYEDNILKVVSLWISLIQLEGNKVGQLMVM